MPSRRTLFDEEVRTKHDNNASPGYLESSPPGRRSRSPIVSSRSDRTERQTELPRTPGGLAVATEMKAVAKGHRLVHRGRPERRRPAAARPLGQRDSPNDSVPSAREGRDTWGRSQLGQTTASRQFQLTVGEVTKRSSGSTHWDRFHVDRLPFALKCPREPLSKGTVSPSALPTSRPSRRTPFAAADEIAFLRTRPHAGLHRRNGDRDLAAMRDAMVAPGGERRRSPAGPVELGSTNRSSRFSGTAEQLHAQPSRVRTQRRALPVLRWGHRRSTTSRRTDEHRMVKRSTSSTSPGVFTNSAGQAIRTASSAPNHIPRDHASALYALGRRWHQATAAMLGQPSRCAAEGVGFKRPVRCGGATQRPGGHRHPAASGSMASAGVRRGLRPAWPTCRWPTAPRRQHEPEYGRPPIFPIDSETMRYIGVLAERPSRSSW